MDNDIGRKIVKALEDESSKALVSKSKIDLILIGVVVILIADVVQTVFL